MPKSTLRELSRQAVTQRISDLAIELFAEHGYDATTVEQIAAAAGISERTFFRYFATKDEVFFTQATAEFQALVDYVLAQPESEDPWTTLRVALEHTLIDANSEENARRSKALRTIMSNSPALLGHQFTRLSASLQAISDVLWERWAAATNERAGAAEGRIHIRTLVGAMVGAFTEVMSHAEELPFEERMSMVGGALEAIRPGRPDLGGAPKAPLAP